MTKVAVLDDWQGVARGSADWSGLEARAEVVFFADAFADEDDAARQLADFEIVLSMRERTPLPASLINRLPKLRMLGMTGGRNASLDTAACTARGVVVCHTVAGGGSTNELRHRRTGAGPDDRRGARFGGGRCEHPRAGGSRWVFPSASGWPARHWASSGSAGSAATWRATATR